jgi:nucleoside-diphosphate-sugar epimerase
MISEPQTPQNEQTVLITGASGFLASHIIDSFISRGYNVRGTVRSKSAGEKVWAKHLQHASHLSLVVVPDLAVSNGQRLQQACLPPLVGHF